MGTVQGFVVPGSSHPQLPTLSATQVMGIYDTQKEMDREAFQAVLQKMLTLMVRLLGSLANGEGLLSCPEAEEIQPPDTLPME